MSIEPNKVIYSMIGVSKYYDKRPVLTDISLSYFYGAKIGVLGLNGSGKSSLLRILAGVDPDFNGKTILTPGHTVGFLEQEPVLEDALNTRGRAILINTLTMAPGFGVLVLSSMAPQRQFGFFIALALLTATIGCFFILPALMLRRDKRGS